jgi:hypothetical protein
MTRIKSLKVETGYPHREHRSKKNRNYRDPRDIKASRDRKLRLEKLTIEEQSYEDAGHSDPTLELS